MAVGAAFAVVGAAVLVGVLTPGDNPTVSRTNVADVQGLSPGTWRPVALPATAASSASLTLNWYATTGKPGTLASVNVSLYAAHACPPSTIPCEDQPALRYWNGTSAGLWQRTGSAGSMYLLYVDAPGNQNVSDNVSATFVEQYHLSNLPLPLIPFAIVLVGGGLLAGVGAVGLYLGLFLPSGVYDAPAEGSDDTDLDPIPRDASEGVEGGPPTGTPDRED